ncbi:hypothetical protein [Kocuria massiliensis]|uniref:hypothetical protein n=1 Tax=Kocuria massiliensis TaxID=1926282 RepID=UPI001301F7F4|nr:hypothetical protein [Kocuria massiliensis]
MTNRQHRPTLNLSPALTGVDFPAPASFKSLFNQAYYEIPWVKELTRKMSQPILDQLTPQVGATVKMPRVVLPQQEAIANEVMQSIGPFSHAWNGYFQTSDQASLGRASEIYADVLRSLFPNYGFSVVELKPLLVQADHLVSTGVIPNHVLHDLEADYNPDSVADVDGDGVNRTHQSEQGRRVFVFLTAIIIGTLASTANQSIPDGDISLEGIHGLLHLIEGVSGGVGTNTASSWWTSHKKGSDDTTRDVK